MSFLPFARPTIDEDMIAAVADTLRSGWIASGPQVLAFEKALAEYFRGGRHVRVLTSATAAMEVALQMAHVGPGDEVITSAQSFFATANMIVKVGARPVFVDCDLVTRNQDLAATEASITDHTIALMPTHWAAPLDLDALYALARRHNLRVIEDAALAMGAAWQGRRIGSEGDIVCFSFHPNKNMTTVEGGALSVATEAEAKAIETLRFHGITRLADGTRDVAFPGGKFNLSDVSARLGLAQLARLDAWNARRTALAGRYFQRLVSDPPCGLPPRDNPGHNWNMFCVLLPLERLTITRKQFIDAMHAKGIGTGISYEALHLATLYRRYGYREGQFPSAERISRETVTLPLFPSMSFDDVDRVCEAVAEILASTRA